MASREPGSAMRAGDYTGTDLLEVMLEAVNYNRYLLDLIRANAPRTGTILDIGAGIGTFAKALVEQGYDVSCVEPDPRQAESIAAAGMRVVPSIDDVPRESVSFLYGLNVLEHIEDDGDALVRWRARLAPGGRALVYVPAFDTLFSSLDRRVGHYRRYRRLELAGKLRRAGFRDVDCRYADSLGFFAALAYKLVGDRQGGIDRNALVVYDRFLFPASRLVDRLTAGRCFGKNVVALASR